MRKRAKDRLSFLKKEILKTKLKTILMKEKMRKAKEIMAT